MKVFPQVYLEGLSYFPVRRILLYHPPSTNVALVLKEHGFTLVTEHLHPLLFAQHETFLRGPGAVPRFGRRLERILRQVRQLLQEKDQDWRALLSWTLENTVFPERGLFLFSLEKVRLFLMDGGPFPPPDGFWRGLLQRLRRHVAPSEFPHVVLPEGYPPRCYRSLAEAIFGWITEDPPRTPLDDFLPRGTYFQNATGKVLRYYPVWVLHLRGTRAQLEAWEAELRPQRPFWRRAQLYPEKETHEHWVLIGWEEKA